MRKILSAVVVMVLAGPAAAQEFVFDRATGTVSQKDRDQDKEIAALKAEVAALKAKLSPTVVSAPGVAASAPFVLESPCGPNGCPAGCPNISDTTVRYAGGVSTFRPAPGQSSGLITISAPQATFGGTSGCTGGSGVAAPARVGLFGRVRR